jgi:hypothetical protein
VATMAYRAAQGGVSDEEECLRKHGMYADKNADKYADRGKKDVAHPSPSYVAPKLTIHGGAVQVGIQLTHSAKAPRFNHRTHQARNRFQSLLSQMQLVLKCSLCRYVTAPTASARR